MRFCVSFLVIGIICLVIEIIYPVIEPRP
jgi:hypothetical protein